MSDVLLGMVLERLDRSELPGRVQDLVLAAWEGREALERALGGEGGPLPRPARRPGSEGAAGPAGAYLKAVRVEGFRGIGPPAVLELHPGPGLTLVMGRNGSGKSSFAEAVELVLTGTSQRWSGRPRAFRDGWRNVHHPERARIALDLVVEGWPGTTQVWREWGPGQELEEGAAVVQPAGAPRTGLAALGWEGALAAHRPILSYSELGGMLEGGPSKLHDALALGLGLEQLEAVEQDLKAARKERLDQVKRAREALGPLLAELRALDDRRAQRCAAALAAAPWDLDAVAAVLDGGAGAGEGDGTVAALRQLAALTVPGGEEVAAVAARLRGAHAALARLAGTGADRAWRTARLLEEALALHAQHGVGDCPVCGRAGALTPAWQEAAAAEVTRLRAFAASAAQAERDAAAARDAARQLLTPPPPALASAGAAGLEPEPLAAAWERWAAGAGIENLAALAEHLEAAHGPLTAAAAKLRQVAAEELARREDRWRPLARRLDGWLGQARAALRAEAAAADLHQAAAWLTKAAVEIRNERFAPIAEAALANWRLLRHDANVEVERIVFGGKGTRRRVELGVSVDGTASAALGVMSQGELHALALSLFLPRATLPESPFRFVVIDDPVQSMDPAKVDGLARALDQAARGRQVVVFTHDTRLHEAVHRLGIAARVLEVTRQPGSAVSVQVLRDPVRRHLDDAFALACTPELPPAVAARVVPGHCRLALEAAFAERARLRLLREGARHAEVEERLLAAGTLNAKAALALGCEPGKVPAALTNRAGRWAAELLREVNRGAHQGSGGDLKGLVEGCERLARAVRGWPL